MRVSQSQPKDAAELTLRAIATGMVIGVVLTPGNV